MNCHPDISLRRYLVDTGCVPPLVHLLDKPDVRIVSVALEGIENILKCGQRNLNPDSTNPFVAIVEMCGGVDRIEELQKHENPKIYDMAVKILEKYFGLEDEEDGDTMGDNPGGFTFNPNSGAPQGGFQFGQ